MEREMIINSIIELVEEAYGLVGVELAIVVVDKKENTERFIYEGNIAAKKLAEIILYHLSIM